MLKPKAPLSKGSWLAVGKTEGIDQDKLTTKKNICVSQSFCYALKTFQAASDYGVIRFFCPRRKSSITSKISE